MDGNAATVWTNTEFAVDGDSIWFVPHEYCFLYQYDFVNKRVCKRIFLEESTSLWGSHYSVAKEGKYIVIVPGVNHNIYIFDKDSCVLQTIRLPEKENVRECFRKYVIWNGEIFFFPVEYPNIVKVDLNDFSVEEIVIPNQGDNGCATSMLITDVLQRGNFADLCIKDSNKILQFNMESYEGKYFSLMDSQGYSAICEYEGKNILLIEKMGKALVCNENFHKIKEFDLPKNNSGYIDCARYGKGYILVPYKKEDPIIYWTDFTYKIIGNTDEKTDKNHKYLWAYNDYSQVEIVENRALLFDMPEQSLCVIDMNTLKREYQKVAMGEIDDDEKRQMYSLLKRENAVLAETDFWTLRRFIDVLKEDRNEEK